MSYKQQRARWTNKIKKHYTHRTRMFCKLWWRGMHNISRIYGLCECGHKHWPCGGCLDMYCGGPCRNLNCKCKRFLRPIEELIDAGIYKVIYEKEKESQ